MQNPEMDDDLLNEQNFLENEIFYMSPAERDREILLRLREVLLNMTDNMTFITLRIRRDLVRLLEIIVDAVIKEKPTYNITGLHYLLQWKEDKVARRITTLEKLMKLPRNLWKVRNNESEGSLCGRVSLEFENVHYDFSPAASGLHGRRIPGNNLNLHTPKK